MEAVARPYMLASIPKSYMFYRRIASQHYFTPSGGMDDLPGLAELVKATLHGGTAYPPPLLGTHDLSGQTIRMLAFVQSWRPIYILHFSRGLEPGLSSPLPRGSDCVHV